MYADVWLQMRHDTTRAVALGAANRGGQAMIVGLYYWPMILVNIEGVVGWMPTESERLRLRVTIMQSLTRLGSCNYGYQLYEAR